MDLQPTPLRGRRRRVGQPRLAGLSGRDPEFRADAQTAGLAVATVVGLFFLVRAIIAVGDADADGDGLDRNALRSFALIALVVGGALVLASRLPDTAILTLTSIPVEPIVLVAAIPLAYLALGVVAGMDPRRYVTGFVTAAIAWFVILYPNISALPLPSALVNAYQGILPTYLYAFQFPVSKIDRNTPIAWSAAQLGLLTLAVVVTCLVVAYSASVWRLSLAPGEPARGRDRTASRGRAAPEGSAAWNPDGSCPPRGQPADDEAVVLLHLRRDPRPAELLGPQPARRAHALGEAGSSRTRAMAAASSLGSRGGTSRPSRSRRTTPL